MPGSRQRRSAQAAALVLGGALALSACGSGDEGESTGSGATAAVVEGDTITVGEVMRMMEDDFAVVECLGPARYCQVAGVCGARSVFAHALSAYFGVLDGATLDDIAMNDHGLRGALGLSGKSGQ